MDGTDKAGLEWRRCLDEEYRLRVQINRASVDGSRLSGALLRQWWSAVSVVWKHYAIAAAADAPPDPPPIDLATVIANLAAYLAVGQIPGPIGDAASEGRRMPGPSEERDIGLAVAYHKATTSTGLVHNGCLLKIDDPHPTKTIADRYGVTPATVRKWNKRHPPAFLGVNDVTAEVLEGLMSKAAARYRTAGRSHNALNARDAKRQR